MADTKVNVLYEDKFVKLTDTHIFLKKYYFPTGSAKKIAYTDIERICTDKEYGVNPLGFKNWGIGLSKIYWAWGGFPRPSINYVLKVRGSKLDNGFSVEDRDKFCSVLISKGVMNQNPRSKL